MTRLALIATTYFPESFVQQRLHAATTALASWCRLAEELAALPDPVETALYIADDASSEAHFGLYNDRVAALWPPRSPFTVTYLHSPGGVGATLNAAISAARSDGHTLYLYLVDDWAYSGHVAAEISAFARWLDGEPSYGVVRLGPPHPGTRGSVRWTGPATNLWYLDLDRQHGYAYGHRPSIHHARWFDAYGPFVEGQPATDVERVANETFRAYPGPGAALALPSPFTHQDSLSMAEWSPHHRDAHAST